MTGKGFCQKLAVSATQVRSILALALQSHQSILKRRYSTRHCCGGSGVTGIGPEAAVREPAIVNESEPLAS
jgi:hypothetical protein